MKKFILFSLSILLFAACSKDDDTPKAPTIDPNIISFESDENMVDVNGAKITLGEINVVGGATAATHSNIFWAKDYATAGTSYTSYDGLLFSNADATVFFGSYFNNYSNTSPWDTWNGFVLSKNYDNTSTAMDITTQQFSAWATGGANGTKTFAAAYDGGAYGGTYGTPTIELTEPRTVKSLYIANSTAVYLYKTTMPKAKSYSIMIEGSLGGEIGSRSTVVTLIDPSEDFKLADWKKVDLSAWGNVDKITFKATTSDSMTPSYFCIDEIELAAK